MPKKNTKSWTPPAIRKSMPPKVSNAADINEPGYNVKPASAEFQPVSNFANVLRWVTSPGIAGLNYAMRNWAAPANVIGKDLYHKYVRVPFTKMVYGTPRQKVLTENDFSNRYLNTLDSINVSQLNKQVPDWRERTARGDTVRIQVLGSDYVNNYGGTHSRTIPERLVDPFGQIETTLGSYGVRATKDGITTVDTYDFSNRHDFNKQSWYGRLRNLASDVNTGANTPNNEKMKIRIKRKRK